MKNSKIISIIPVNNNLMAVVKLKNGYRTYLVVCLELIESFRQSESGNHDLVREKRAVITWKGKLTPVDNVPGFLGLASSKLEADAMNEEKFKAICDKMQEKCRTANWNTNAISNRKAGETLGISSAGD